MAETGSPQFLPDNDVLGRAILHALQTGAPTQVELALNGVGDEPMDAAVFLRHPSEWPDYEHVAIEACRGKVLDLGAGAGCHSLVLQNQGVDVTALDISSHAAEAMHLQGLSQVVCTDVYSWNPGVQYDTILLLMNGFGMGQRAAKTAAFLETLKPLLAPGGQILGEGTDVGYMAQEWKHVPLEYHGDVQFVVRWNGLEQQFPWVYIDKKRLALEAQAVGMSMELLYEGEGFNYLARLTVD